MASVKICTKCGKVGLDQYDFRIIWHNRDNKYCYISWCTECNKEYRQENKKYLKEYLKKYKREYRQENKGKINTCKAKHRAMKLNQTPININQDKILYIYELCSLMNEYGFGIKYEVDHIKPLSKGGLHHQDNLQILTMEANRCKGAKIAENFRRLEINMIQVI